MKDYTPNTESVRLSIVYLAKYHAERQHCDADLVVVESEVQGQFDRWLAAHDAEVAAKAWDEGFCSMRGENPYRAALGLTAEQGEEEV